MGPADDGDDGGRVGVFGKAAALRKKCFILQTSTERPEAVKVGFCELVGVKPGPALKAINRWFKDGRKVPRKKTPYGNGHASKKVVKILKKEGYC